MYEQILDQLATIITWIEEVILNQKKIDDFEVEDEAKDDLKLLVSDEGESKSLKVKSILQKAFNLVFDNLLNVDNQIPKEKIEGLIALIEKVNQIEQLGDLVHSASTFDELIQYISDNPNKVQNQDWFVLTKDVIGTGTEENPQYESGAYAWNGSTLNFLFDITFWEELSKIEDNIKGHRNYLTDSINYDYDVQNENLETLNTSIEDGWFRIDFTHNSDTSSYIAIEIPLEEPIKPPYTGAVLIDYENVDYFRLNGNFLSQSTNQENKTTYYYSIGKEHADNPSVLIDKLRIYIKPKSHTTGYIKIKHPRVTSGELLKEYQPSYTDVLGIKNRGIKVKLFGDPSSSESGGDGDVRIYYSELLSKKFSLNQNEIGLFFNKTQNNDHDTNTGTTLYLFKKGFGTWGNAEGAQSVTEDDFILLQSTQEAVSTPLGFRPLDIGIDEKDFISYNFDFSKSDKIYKYLIALHKSKANALDQIKLKFSWSFQTDDDAVQQRTVSSTRINGHYALLSISIEGYSVLKLNENVEFTLLIDRYKPSEWKGNTERHRKAGFKHELNPNPFTGYDSNRINEIKIDNSTMIIDFKQDFYFKPNEGFGNTNGFPKPMGIQSKRYQLGAHGNGQTRTGWVDLGFRIRMTKQGSILKYETPILGKIRMLGIMHPSPNGHKSIITYKKL